MLSATYFNLDQSKILSSGKGLTCYEIAKFYKCPNSLPLKLFLDKVENIKGRGENAGNVHFSPFLQCLQKPTPSGSSTLSLLRTTLEAFCGQCKSRSNCKEHAI